MQMQRRLNPDPDGVIGRGVRFERIRRITGYLVGTLDRFNNAKYGEVNERVKHMSFKTPRPAPRTEEAAPLLLPPPMPAAA